MPLACPAEKQCLHLLKSKPRRSLCKLQLKFVQTTAEVCTDFSRSLQKVLRTYKFKCAHLLISVRVLTNVSVRIHFGEYAYPYLDILYF